MVATFCLDGLTINGDIRLSCTSSVNHARRRVASRGVGIASLGVVQPSATPGAPARGGVSFGAPCTDDIRDDILIQFLNTTNKSGHLLSSSSSQQLVLGK